MMMMICVQIKKVLIREFSEWAAREGTIIKSQDFGDKWHVPFDLDESLQIEFQF